MEKVALLLVLGSLAVWAEPQYYRQANGSTWEDARRHCQLCYKELASLNSENILLVAQNLSSDYWVGLRENLNGTMLWSVWSNGDPVTFQNWYPGHPKMQEQIPPTPLPTTPVTTRTPAPQTFSGPQPLATNHMCRIELEDLCRNLTNHTELYIYDGSEERYEPETPVTEAQPTVTAEPEPVVRDPCVVLLSFGMWMDRNCSELLPYICYEDRFYGSVNFSNVTLKSASFSWSPAPGDIDFYRLELTGDISLTTNTSGLWTGVGNLTQGTLYRVQVFPVKCGRDLNPQNTSFYTKPDVIRNLSIAAVGTTSVHLSWVKPVGNHGFYSVQVLGPAKNSTLRCTSHDCPVTELSPGTLYQFHVYAEVMDQSIVGDPTNISSYTRPTKVKNLRILSNDTNCIQLEWDQSDNVSLEFQVVVDITRPGNLLLTHNTSSNSVNVCDLIPGNSYIFTVVPQVDDLSQTGESATITGYTTPSIISNLSLCSNQSAIMASWTLPTGNYTSFYLTIQSDDGKELKNSETNVTTYTFNVNKAAANYTVTVWTMVEKIKGQPVRASKYTLPVKPGPPSVFHTSNTSITIQWQLPSELDSTATFLVTYTSSFWQFTNSCTVKNNSITVQNLQPGTYYNFSIQTEADNEKSDPVTITSLTEPQNRSLIISMQCSSSDTLFCENPSGSSAAYEQLTTKLTQLLQNNVFYVAPTRRTEP